MINQTQFIVSPAGRIVTQDGTKNKRIRRMMRRSEERYAEIEAELKQLTSRLERRVAERTEELTSTNARLRAEILRRQHAEAVLRDREERLRAIMETSPVAIFTTDTHGVIESLNRACCRMFGYGRGEMIGKEISLLLPLRSRPNQGADLMRQLRAGGGVMGAGREVRGRRKDGTWLSLYVLMSEFRAGGRRHFAGFLSDIMRRKQLEKEILEIRDREQQRIGKDLHDGLGQHLHAVSYLASLLRSKLDDRGLPEAAEAGRLSQLLDEALHLSHDVASGLEPVLPVPEGLGLALRELARRVRSVYRIDCRFGAPRNFCLLNHTAATHLYRIAQEAVNNAIRHARSSRIRIDLSVRSGLTTLRILNNGPALPRLSPNHQGMGRRIMQSRADAIGATFLIRSTPRQGTAVTVTLPAPEPVSPPSRNRP